MLRIIFVYRNTEIPYLLVITIDTNSQLTDEMHVHPTLYLLYVRINHISTIGNQAHRFSVGLKSTARRVVFTYHMYLQNERKQRVCVTTCSRHINKHSRAIIIYECYLQSTMRRCIGRQINQKFRVCRKFTFYLFLYLIKSQLCITTYIIN